MPSLAWLERVRVTSYVTPLREESGSLPAVEADNLGTYVLKFRGAGQVLRRGGDHLRGTRAQARVPRPRAGVGLADRKIAASEPDQEIQELLSASEGLNLAASPA